MKKNIFILLIVFLLIFSGCDKSDAYISNEIAKPEITEEIVFFTSLMADYSKFLSFNTIVNEVPVIIKATIKETHPTIVTGGHSIDEFDNMMNS